MQVDKQTVSLEDRKPNVKVKLALLWIALMFLYIYNDILSFYQPGHVADLQDGHLEGFVFTQSALFGAAVLMALPSFMILICLTMHAKVNRLVNIVAGFFHILVLFGTQFVGDADTWYYWRLFELIEAVFLVVIIGTAWKWPTTESYVD